MTQSHYTKADVHFHRVGYGGPGLPAVNVKHWPDFEREVDWDEFGGRDTVFHDWCLSQLRDDAVLLTWLGSAQEQCWEDVKEWACEVFGPLLRSNPKVWSEGRQGGWAVVEGLPDLEDWDAVMLAKWRRFERDCKLIAADQAYRTVFGLYHNVWEFVREDLSRSALELAGAK